MKSNNPKSANYSTGGKVRCETNNNVRVPQPSFAAKLLSTFGAKGGGRE